MAKFVSCLCFVAVGAFLGTALVQATSRQSEPSKQAWPWDRFRFKCPSMNGVFANVDDCQTFYLCVMGISRKTSCPPFTKFDKYTKRCLASIIATCDTGDAEDTTEAPQETTTETKITTNKDFFACPSIFGTFAHPTDCRKYYVCALLLPALKVCSEKELFDGVKLKCRKAKYVDCGSRFTSEPGDLTTLPETTPHDQEETTTSEPDTEATPEPTTTTPEPDTESTPEPTTTQEPTTEEEPTKPTGPPETDCDEDDLDCIITETGNPPNAWFTCPEGIGSHPHPSSNRLFIFCLNWEPMVKKCGQDLVYSHELRTCIDDD